jgi:hypothetical protein
MSEKALFPFSDVEANRPTVTTLRENVRQVMKADKDACATAMERFMLPPGPSGSREYDHAYAVDTLLQYDAKHGGYIASVMVATGLSRRMIFDEIVKVYRKAGFKVSHGRIVGLLEDQTAENGNDRADSIE